MRIYDKMMMFDEKLLSKTHNNIGVVNTPQEFQRSKIEWRVGKGRIGKEEELNNLYRAVLVKKSLKGRWILSEFCISIFYENTAQESQLLETSASLCPK